MNILYVTNVDPRTIDHGNAQRTNLLWKSLSRNANVYTICINDSIEEGLTEERNGLVLFFNPTKHFQNKWLNWAYRLQIRLSGIAYLPISYNISLYISKAFPGVKFDAVVTRYIFNFAKYHLWNIAPAYVDIDDHPAQFFDTVVSKRIPSFLKPLCKAINRFQIKKIFGRIRGGWISNGNQLQMCPKYINYLPNIPQRPPSSYRINEESRKYLFTIGNMEYAPNYKGVDIFLSEIWPEFHLKYPDVDYFVCGRGLPEKYLEKWSDIGGVKYLGFVEDIDKLYQYCLASVVPVYAGGGTCIKTLESLSYSRACLSTPFGARGLNVSDVNTPSTIMIFDNAEGFIDSFNNILNASNRQEMEEEGRLFIENYYSETSFFKAINNVMKNR